MNVFSFKSNFSRHLDIFVLSLHIDVLSHIQKSKKFNLLYLSEKKSDHSDRICFEKGKNNILM